MSDEADDYDFEDDDGSTAISTASAAMVMPDRGDIEAQIDAAHKYPRQIKRFVAEARSLAIVNRETAEKCIYAVTRGGKAISGPSIRLAEICASSWGNLHVGARVVGAEAKEVVAQGAAWDLEKNLRVLIDVRRRITGKSGRRFSDDMITVTGMAAVSIALRNAIFRVIPRPHVDAVYSKVRDVAVGNAETLAVRRGEVVERLQKMGVPRERIFTRLGKAGLEDVGLEELEILIGLGTSIKSGDRSIDEAFPAPDKTAEKNAKLEAELAGAKPEAPPPATGPKTKAKSAPKADEPPPAAEPDRGDNPNDY